MDPLSITAGIVAIVGATGTVGKGLQKLAQTRHAPEILVGLKDEVSDLHLLIEGTSDLARYHESVFTKSLGPAALRGLKRIQNTVLVLEKLIVYDLTTIVNSDGQIEIDRLAWIKSQNRLQQIKSQIQADRIYLSTALNLANV